MTDESYHDPFDELEWARRDMEILNENVHNLEIKEWMQEWRAIRARMTRAAFAIEQQARNLT
jgi:hypothetical protein